MKKLRHSTWLVFSLVCLFCFLCFPASGCVHDCFTRHHERHRRTAGKLFLVSRSENCPYSYAHVLSRVPDRADLLGVLLLWLGRKCIPSFFSFPFMFGRQGIVLADHPAPLHAYFKRIGSRMQLYGIDILTRLLLFIAFVTYWYQLFKYFLICCASCDAVRWQTEKVFRGWHLGFQRELLKLSGIRHFHSSNGADYLE